MMDGWWLTIGSETVLLAAAVVGFFLLCSAALDDVAVLHRRRRIRATIRRLCRPRQPPVTILVYARDTAATIVACLDSIRHCRYHEVDVIVVNDHSTDATKRIVNAYRQAQPGLALRLYTPRRTVPMLTALQRGYQRSRRGELVYSIDGASMVDPDMIKISVARFVVDPRLRALKVREVSRDPTELRVSGLADNCQAATRLIWYKSLAASRVGRMPVGMGSAVYDAAAFMAARPGQRLGYRFESTPLLHRLTPMSSSLSPRAGWWWLALLAALAMTYAMIAAARLQTASLLFLGWALVGGWFVVALWADDTLPAKFRFNNLLGAPAMYFLLYARLVVAAATGGVRLLGRLGSASLLSRK